MGYVATRGCPHQCAFCYNAVFNERQWRHPSVAKVVRDVNALADRHRLGGVVFHDDNFTANRQWALDVLEGLRVPALHIETRIDYVSDAFLQQLVDRKVQSVFFGIESGSDRILDLLKKGFSVQDIRRALSLVNRHPLLAKLSVILGCPTETVADHRATLDLVIWCIENLPRTGFTIGFYLPFPGTPLFDLCCQRGFTRPEKFEGWVRMDRWGNQETPIPWTDGEYLTSREVAKLRKWSRDLIRLRASSRWRDRLGYVVLRWRFRNSGSRLVLVVGGFAQRLRWRASRAFRDRRRRRAPFACASFCSSLFWQQRTGRGESEQKVAKDAKKKREVSRDEDVL
jgi:radical SAM superfamily enzyme YgiQ (UPF0313 family)